VFETETFQTSLPATWNCLTHVVATTKKKVLNSAVFQVLLGNFRVMLQQRFQTSHVDSFQILVYTLLRIVFTSQWTLRVRCSWTN